MEKRAVELERRLRAEAEMHAGELTMQMHEFEKKVRCMSGGVEHELWGRRMWRRKQGNGASLSGMQH